MEELQHHGETQSNPSPHSHSHSHSYSIHLQAKNPHDIEEGQIHIPRGRQTEAKVEAEAEEGDNEIEEGQIPTYLIPRHHADADADIDLEINHHHIHIHEDEEEEEDEDDHSRDAEGKPFDLEYSNILRSLGLKSLTHSPATTTDITHSTTLPSSHPYSDQPPSTTQFNLFHLPTTINPSIRQQETALWSLPLPPPVQYPESSAPVVDLSHGVDRLDDRISHSVADTVTDPLRSRLVEIGLPPQHVETIVKERQQHLTQHPHSDQPIQYWIDRVMDEMYRQEQNATSSAQVESKTSTAANSFISTQAPIVAAASSSSSSSSFSSPPLSTNDTIVPIDPSPSNLSIICGICWDPIPFEDIPSRHGTPSCKHLFCSPCWNGYLSSQILANHVVYIRCPFVGRSNGSNPTGVSTRQCQRFVESEEICSRLRSQEMRDRYRRQLYILQVARDPLSKWCTRAGCETVIRRSDMNMKDGVCSTCQTHVCMVCGLPSHPKLTCADANDSTLRLFIESTISGDRRLLDLQSCPSCGECIERESGCNFVRCVRCQFEMCWLCRQEYTDIHYEWWNLRGCPLMHLQSCGWIGDNQCCGCQGGPWIGACKRGLLRTILLFLYLLLSLFFLPFLLLGSPYLLYRYYQSRSLRQRRREIAERNRQLLAAQLERAGLKTKQQD